MRPEAIKQHTEPTHEQTLRTVESMLKSLFLTLTPDAYLTTDKTPVNVRAKKQVQKMIELIKKTKSKNHATKI